MSQVNSPVQLLKSASTSLIKLTGEINILQAAALKDVLIEVASGTKPIRIDMSMLDELDVTTIQLLCSAKNKAIVNGLDFDISPISENGREFIKCSGALYEFISSED